MIDWASGSRRGFLHRAAGALVLSAALGLLFVAPGVSAQSDNAPLYSQWYGASSADALDLLLDEEIAAAPADSADFNVGSFALHRPQSELFINGLIGEWYDAAAAAALSADAVEAYLQARARAQLTAGGQAPDFKTWLSARGYDLGDRLLSGGANYLTAAAAAGAQDLRFVRTVEWDYQTSLGERPWQGGFSALGALRERADDAVAWQLRGYVAEDSVVGANAGVIYRRAAAFAGGGLVGANVFLDYERSDDYREHFWRWSVGGEYRNAHVDIYLNRYFAITDDAEQNDGGYAYTQGGQEAHLNVKAPDFGIGQVSGGLTYYLWEGEYGDSDDEGLRYHLGFSPRRSGFKLEVELDSPDSGGTDWGGRLSYRHVVGAADKGNAADAVAVFDARTHFFDPVRREYAQRLRDSGDDVVAEPEAEPVYNNLYLLGGRQQAVVSPTDSQIGEVWASDDNGENWELISPAPAPTDGSAPQAADEVFPARYDHAAAVLNGTIFISGGRAGDIPLSDVWASADGVDWTQMVTLDNSSPPQPVAVDILSRENHAMVSYQNSLYIIGGISGIDYRFGVWSSPDGKTWSQVQRPNPYPARTSFSALVHHDGNGEDIYVISGDASNIINTATTDRRSTAIFKSAGNNIALLAHKTSGTYPYRRINAQAVSFNGKIYLIGGEVYSSPASADSIVELDPADVWSSVDGINWEVEAADNPSMSFPNLTNHTAYANDTAIFVVGGQLGNTGIERRIVLKSTDGKNWEEVSDNPGFGGRLSAAGVLFKAPGEGSDSDGNAIR